MEIKKTRQKTINLNRALVSLLWLNNKDMTNVQRFLSKVYPEPNTGCFIYLGSPQKNGYNLILSKTYNGFCLAHRFAYYLEYGEFNRSLQVCHSCDNPFCVNPQHLFLGTQFDNNLDMTQKGRRVRGEGFSSSKLTNNLVIELRTKYDTGSYTQKQLIEEYGIKKTTMNSVLKRKLWNHI